MNIKEVAEISRLPAKTIRFYEDIGLVRPGRATNGYRRFTERDLHKLAFIGRARGLGFTIEDCRTLLSLYEDRDRASAEVKRIAEGHLSRIEAKIVELEAMKRTLGGGHVVPRRPPSRLPYSGGSGERARIDRRIEAKTSELKLRLWHDSS